MTAGVLLPNGEQQFFDANGDPLAGGFVYTYVPGTSTPSTTWVDQDLATANTNPIHLDGGGRCIIWGDTSYRQVVTDSLGNLIWDQVTSDGGITALANQVAANTAAIAGLMSSVGLQLDVIVASGSYTLKAAKVIIFVIGDGGGGAGTNGGATVNPSAGGSGAVVIGSLSGLTVGDTLAVTIGPGGAGGGTNNTGGSAGSGTTVASGTQVISTLDAGGGGGAASPTGTGGTGGTPSGGTVQLTGQQGTSNANGSIAGIPGLFAPYGAGGSVRTDNSQDGLPGLVIVMGNW